jgi:hypothetical protein
MATDLENVDHLEHSAPDRRERGLVIFTYPKTIFLVPTLIVATVCCLGMLAIGDRIEAPSHAPPVAAASRSDRAMNGAPASTSPRRPPSTQNVLAMAFLGVFGLNLLIMSLDFPRFTVIVAILLALTLVFFTLWLSVYFDLMPPLVGLLERFSAAANAQFYFLMAATMLVILGIISATRRLDYWVIRPNEILHNHGPFSDLERYPTYNMKFDKEISNIFEYLMLRSGRIVLHVAGDRKAIVLDNVLSIDSKEESLKRLLGRLNVRVTTDREVADDRTAPVAAPP